MSVIEELQQARKQRLARFRQATLRHFDRCYDEAQASLSLPQPPEPPAKQALARIVAAPKPFRTPLTIASIQSTVAARFNITREELVSPSKRPEYVRPRQIAMYLIRKTTNLPLKKLGKAFGGRDHSTAFLAVRTAEHMMANDTEYAALVDEIGAEFTA
jgi:chromosomal replication initiation ATPase DnaA